ncbi:MAG: 16S rRNA (guanine(527)-N(7))-methyltransferase RsmG [Oscillospiraceae bacterium]|nr:16S rRNA (guanine(527)-N(7))-methyltransferase RsmG [Oscillospiraceae bacterium]
MEQIIKNILLSSNKGITEKQAEMFAVYARMLVKRNEKINLTSVTDPADIAVKHFLDSISPLWVTKISGSIADVGTGAGFPAVPLKIMRPDLHFTLIDSLAKRIKFLDDVKSELGLENITLIHSRAEDAGRDKNLREQFDFCVSRAVANTATLSELCLPLVKPGGALIALKGPLAESELECAKKAISALGGRIARVCDVYIPHSDLNHKIVIIKKVRHTSDIYPRKAPLPSKNPII